MTLNPNTKIISIEGPDGVGKSTVIEILKQKFPSPLYLKFPDYSNTTGKIIKQILTKELPFPDPLVFQSLQLANKVETLFMYPNAPLIITDRYIDSTIVYGSLDGIPKCLLWRLNSVLPYPFISFVITGKNFRLNSDHYEAQHIQEKIHQLYESLVINTPNHYLIKNNDKRPDQIADKILFYLTLNNVGNLIH